MTGPQPDSIEEQGAWTQKLPSPPPDPIYIVGININVGGYNHISWYWWSVKYGNNEWEWFSWSFLHFGGIVSEEVAQEVEHWELMRNRRCHVYLNDVYHYCARDNPCEGRQLIVNKSD